MMLTLKIDTQFIYVRITLRSFNKLNICIDCNVCAHIKMLNFVNGFLSSLGILKVFYYCQVIIYY